MRFNFRSVGPLPSRNFSSCNRRRRAQNTREVSLLAAPVSIAAPASTPASAGAAHWVGAYFRQLGTEIERRIAGVPLTSDAFAEAATATLQECAPEQPIDAAAMGRWVTSGEPLPRQVNFHVTFGQPPLAVYVGSSFYLEVLFWFPSRTSIHGHGFSGAFRVLDGYSLQTTYSFTETERWDEALRLGELRARQLELLLPGAVCDIRADEAFVHSVVHMGFPSLTLVARTFAESSVLQYDYCRCGIAYSPFRRRQELTRQLDVMLALARRDATEAAAQMKAFLARQDAFGRFALCLRLAGRNGPFANDVMAWAALEWPRVAGLARLVAEEEQRMARVYRDLAQLPEAAAQLLGALSELFGTREDVLRALQTFHPSEPAETTLARWAGLVPPVPCGLRRGPAASPT